MGCVRKRGGSWSAQVRVAGWRSFNRTFQTKSDALKWINNLELKLRSSDVPDTVNSQKTTFAELLEKYAGEVSPSHKGAGAEIYRLKSIARSWLGRIDVRYLNKHQFNQYRDDRLKTVLGGSVCAELALMKRVLETAKRRWGVGIPYNPILEIEFPRGSNPRNRRLRHGELERLLTAASSQRNIYIAPIIEFAIETGMRRSEILNLRWVDIDLDSGFASLFDTKNGGEADGLPSMSNSRARYGAALPYRDKDRGFPNFPPPPHHRQFRVRFPCDGSCRVCPEAAGR